LARVHETPPSAVRRIPPDEVPAKSVPDEEESSARETIAAGRSVIPSPSGGKAPLVAAHVPPPSTLFWIPYVIVPT
jgi:hypothetical protein